MKKIYINKVIEIILFFLVVSLYLFTYRANLYWITNFLIIIFIGSVLVSHILGNKTIIWSKFLTIQFIFLSVCLGSVLYAKSLNIAISKVNTLTLIYILIVVLVNYIDSYEKVISIMKYFIWAGSLASISIIKDADFSQLGRFGEKFGNVNVVGMILGIAATFCIYMIIDQKKKQYFLVFFLLITTILLTGSRKSLIFIISNIVIILYLKNRKSIADKIKFIFLITGCIGTFAYVIFNIEIFYEIIGWRVENLLDFTLGNGTKEASINVRADMIEYGLNIFKEKPIWGYGINNYRVLYGGIYSHSNYIELLVGTGIVGVCIYYFNQIFLLIKLCIEANKNKYSEIYYTFFAIIFSYNILSPSLVYYDDKHFNIILAIASTLILFSTRYKKEFKIKEEE